MMQLDGKQEIPSSLFKYFMHYWIMCSNFNTNIMFVITVYPLPSKLDADSQSQ